MKIIFMLPNLFAGGAERVVTILSAGMRKLGFHVQILLFTDDLCQYEIPDEIELFCLNTKQDNRFQRTNKLIHHLINEKKNEKILLIPFQESCLKYAVVAGRLLRIPVIATERNSPYRHGRSIFHKIKATIPFYLSSKCVFQTDEARNYYYLPDGKCKVIANPIRSANQVWTGNCNPADLIMICRLHHQKNIPLIIDAIERLKKTFPNIHLSIYGEGEIKEELQAIIDEKQLTDVIILKGTTNNVLDKLIESSIFISSSDFEGISNSMLEAMSVGMPIVCTDCPIGGARLMLADGAGALVKVNDCDQMVETITRLLFDKELMLNMGKNALEKAKAFSPDRIVKEWIDLIETIQQK